MIRTASESLRILWLSLTCGIGTASGEVSGSTPRAAQLVVTGACSSSANPTQRREGAGMDDAASGVNHRRLGGDQYLRGARDLFGSRRQWIGLAVLVRGPDRGLRLE